MNPVQEQLQNLSFNSTTLVNLTQARIA